MTFDEFCRTEPCLEELAGFREQRMKDDQWSDEDQVDYLMQEDRLRKGKDIPAKSNFNRAYIYKRGKPPKKRYRHA